MSQENAPESKKRFTTKWLLLLPIGAIAAGLCFAIYINLAFPEERVATVEHLKSPDEVSDCYECHLKATPKIGQNWYESKHGVILIKCFVCHGQPDGKGAVPYAVNPDVNGICRKCHDPSVKKMEEKFGPELDCNKCHPFHQSSLHHEPYVKPEAKKKID